MDNRMTHERNLHRTSLAAWSMVSKSLALAWWVGGVLFIAAQLILLRQTQSAGQPIMVPQGALLSASLAVVVLLFIAFFAVGALSRAISLVLTSMGYIEENTRSAASPLNLAAGTPRSTPSNPRVDPASDA